MWLRDAADELAAAGIDPRRTGDDAEFDRVVHRTDRVEPGALFCCIRGSRVDGHELAPDAVDAGAVALLVERALPLPVPQLIVPSVRQAMGHVASRCHDHPSRAMAVVGVTGTNGKTTTVSLVQSILQHAGRRCEVIGTLTSEPDGPPTTPDAPELQERLARWRDDGVDAVAMEVSSHALAMGRVNGTWFAATAFTMLGHDHLDLHGDLEHYFEAKASLFEPERTSDAVVRSDDPWGQRILERLRGTSVAAHPFALADAGELRHEPAGVGFDLDGTRVRLPLAGAHNVANALCAARLAAVLGVDGPTAARGLEAVSPVAGRFELVDEGQSFTVAVDYAHTPDALETVIEAARDLARDRGRVIVVFGCGGDRDRAKRPQMGAVAARSADVVVVTSDNPRSEDPSAIIDDVVAGVEDARRAGLHREPDRAAAIHHAISAAQDHDVVVIAGKGHETTQTFADRVEPFDDRQVAASVLREVRGR